MKDFEDDEGEDEDEAGAEVVVVVEREAEGRETGKERPARQRRLCQTGGGASLDAAADAADADEDA